MPTLESASLSGCNTSMNKGEKRHFPESELEIVVNDVEPRREILSGPPSAGVHMKRKEWERVWEAVHNTHTHTHTHTHTGEEVVGSASDVTPSGAPYTSKMGS